MINSSRSTSRTFRALAVSASALASAALLFAAPAQAQQDTRWQPYVGCWVQTEVPTVGSTVSGSMMCVVPVPNSQSIEVATIANKQVVQRERVTATGERINKTVDNCPGWESAMWSSDGRRVLLRSEFACANNVTVKGSSVLSMNAEGGLVQVQGTTVGLNAGARIVRYRAADVALAPGTVISDSAIVRTVPAETGFALQSQRAAAGGSTSVESLVDLSKNVDSQVAQAWLTEFGRPENLSAKQLVAMADAGLPTEMIDLMVAMSYPERFTLRARTDAGADNSPRPTSADMRDAQLDATCSAIDSDLRGSSYISRMDLERCGRRYGSMYGYYPFGYLSGYRYGWDYGSYYNRGFNNNSYYYGNQPIIIVTRPADGVNAAPGHAVKGQGYTRETGSSSTSSGTSQPRTTTSSSGSSGSTSTSGGATSIPASGGGDTGRTAKPRPPGGH